MDRNTNIACHVCVFCVALRKESVDRNKYVVQCRKILGVALRKESVDRNGVGNWPRAMNPCRSPQGERG